MQHTVQITLDDALIHERDPAELQQSMKQGLILLDYLSAEISIGRFAELMSMSYVQAMDWLHSRGIATLRRLKDQAWRSHARPIIKTWRGIWGAALPNDGAPLQ